MMSYTVKKEHELEYYNETLIGAAWIIMSPENAIKEIELAMVKAGSCSKYFTFKPLTPVYVTMKAKLTDPEYWTKFGWTFKKQMKQEKEKAAMC